MSFTLEKQDEITSNMCLSLTELSIYSKRQAGQLTIRVQCG